MCTVDEEGGDSNYVSASEKSQLKIEQTTVLNMRTGTINIFFRSSKTHKVVHDGLARRAVGRGGRTRRRLDGRPEGGLPLIGRRAVVLDQQLPRPGGNLLPFICSTAE